MMRPYVGSWKRLAVHGVAAVFFGLAALVWPGITLYALVLLWGAFALVDGITALSAAIGDRLLIDRGWVAFSGVTGIGAGIVTFLWPSMTALALLVVIATWSLLVGGSWIAFAIKERKQVVRSVAPSRSVASSWCCSASSSSSTPAPERSASPGRSAGSSSCSAPSSFGLHGRYVASRTSWPDRHASARRASRTCGELR